MAKLNIETSTQVKKNGRVKSSRRRRSVQVESGSGIDWATPIISVLTRKRKSSIPPPPEDKSPVDELGGGED